MLGLLSIFWFISISCAESFPLKSYLSQCLRQVLFSTLEKNFLILCGAAARVGQREKEGERERAESRGHRVKEGFQKLQSANIHGTAQKGFCQHFGYLFPSAALLFFDSILNFFLLLFVALRCFFVLFVHFAAFVVCACCILLLFSLFFGAFPCFRLLSLAFPCFPLLALTFRCSP